MSGPSIAGVELASRGPGPLAEFYVNALGFSCESSTPDAVTLQLGAARIWLLRANPSGREMPADSRSDDGWFRHIAIVVRNMEKAFAQLMKHDVALISEKPQTLPQWNAKSAGIEALYFRDPEGHPLELLHFPPDKGKPAWHQPGEGLFQGIDHTGIVVSNAPASVEFYRRETGIRPSAEVVNYGEEQERLTQVQGARMHVVSLAGASGIGLELLDYGQPKVGRAMPNDTGRNDIWWSRTVMQTAGEKRISPLRDADRHETLIR